jgi:hypothetical protein
VIAKLTALSKPLIIVTALALLVDLMLHWRKAPVQSQWVSGDGASSALHGLGVVAALLVIAVIVVALFVRDARIALGVAIAAAGFTFAAFFTLSASVLKVEGVALVAESQTTLWPAFAGLVLAVALVAAAGLRVFEPPPVIQPMPPLPASYHDASSEAEAEPTRPKRRAPGAALISRAGRRSATRARRNVARSPR